MTIFIRTRRFFSVFSVFPFYVFPFPFFVFPFPLMLMHMLMLMLMLILIQKRNINVNVNVIFSLYVLSSFIHCYVTHDYLYTNTSLFLNKHVVFSSFVHPHSKTKQTHVNFSSFESLIRPLSHQHHSAIYTFYNHESPSFYEST